MSNKRTLRTITVVIVECEGTPAKEVEALAELRLSAEFDVVSVEQTNEVWPTDVKLVVPPCPF